MIDFASATDEELATWQSGWKPDTKQFILSEKEWQRRMIELQFIKDKEIARLARINGLICAAVGIVGAVIGALLGYYLAVQ